MSEVSVTRLGGILIVHRDNPCDAEVRRRVQILLMGGLPRRGVVEAWAGDRADEVHWRRLRAR